MEREIVNLLWTGGYDSTYRLVQLSREECTIQPYYIVNPKRESLEYERKAMKDIYELLQAKPATKAELLPIKEINRGDYPVRQEIKDAYKGVLSKVKLGPQYEWLSEITYHIPDLEMSFEKAEADPSDFENLVQNSDFTTIHGEDRVRAVNVMTDKNDKDQVTLLGNLRFPVDILNRTKKDFLVDFQAWDCMDIAKKTWFCSTPINGEPCGYCAPCRSVVAEGLEFRLPENSMKRYKNRYFWMVKYKIAKTWKQITGQW